MKFMFFKKVLALCSNFNCRSDNYCNLGKFSCWKMFVCKMFLLKNFLSLRTF